MNHGTGRITYGEVILIGTRNKAVSGRRVILFGTGNKAVSGLRALFKTRRHGRRKGRVYGGCGDCASEWGCRGLRESEGACRDCGGKSEGVLPH